MAANADISRRKAERRAQKLDKEVSHLQTQLTNHQRYSSFSPTSSNAWIPIHIAWHSLLIDALHGQAGTSVP